MKFPINKWSDGSWFNFVLNWSFNLVHSLPVTFYVNISKKLGITIDYENKVEILLKKNETKYNHNYSDSFALTPVQRPGGPEERQNGKKEIYLHWKGSWLSLALLSYGLPYGLNRKMKRLTMLWWNCLLVRSSKNGLWRPRKRWGKIGLKNGKAAQDCSRNYFRKWIWAVSHTNIFLLWNWRSGDLWIISNLGLPMLNQYKVNCSFHLTFGNTERNSWTSDEF